MAPVHGIPDAYSVTNSICTSRVARRIRALLICERGFELAAAHSGGGVLTGTVRVVQETSERGRRHHFEHRQREPDRSGTRALVRRQRLVMGDAPNGRQETP